MVGDATVVGVGGAVSVRVAVKVGVGVWVGVARVGLANVVGLAGLGGVAVSTMRSAALGVWCRRADHVRVASIRAGMRNPGLDFMSCSFVERMACLSHHITFSPGISVVWGSVGCRFPAVWATDGTNSVPGSQRCTVWDTVGGNGLQMAYLFPSFPCSSFRASSACTGVMLAMSR
jgi:hypothetical protein